MTKAIHLVQFSVLPEKESEFNAFYHQQFLPQLHKHSPELDRIRRYEESGVGGTLRWYHKQFLTIYELKSGAGENIDQIFERPTVQEVVKQFRTYKESALHNFSRITFQPTWAHQRQLTPSFDGPFFLWQLEMKPEMDAEFQRWYEEQYLPLQIAEIPTWTGARRFRSEKKEPVRHLTFFETRDETALARSLTDLRGGNRIEQNYEWQRRVEPAVVWHDATSFRPIYRWPD